MLGIIVNLEGWQRWTGASIIFLLIFLSVLYVNGQKEAIELPSTVNEIKQNVTKELMTETSKAGIDIISRCFLKRNRISLLVF